jgi:hypothetical protein
MDSRLELAQHPRARRRSARAVTTVFSALSIAAVSVPVMAAPAAAQTTTPVPVCAGAKNLLVDVTQDVLNQPFLPARDGHIWANFSYTQHLHIYAVGAHQYCIRKDFEGTWVSVAGLSPGLTGTISDGVTGTFTDTTYWEWTGTLTPLAPTSGYLGGVDADCTAVDVCADDDFLIVDKFYFPQGSHHCNSVRRDLEVDGGAHGHISLVIEGDVNRVSATGDITG